ncbi:hypothetical protein QCD79_34075, partial [Pseudomonas quasicaspiana]|nr:hypothetical protein [Pseudomonas quasicaspiana]
SLFIAHVQHQIVIHQIETVPLDNRLLKLFDFFVEEFDKLQKAIVERHGFDLVDHNLVLYVRNKKA